MPLWAISFLILTAAVSLLGSHYSPLGGDEIIELWGDKTSSLAQLIHIQRTMSLNMDPFFFHGLTFAVIRIFGIRDIYLTPPCTTGSGLTRVANGTGSVCIAC